MKSKNKVLVIVINYRTSHLMQALVDSITENKVETSVLIVDNASTAETYNELLLVKDERVTTLRSEQNLGFTGGINFALKYAVEKMPDIKYFFLLNPDAFSCPDLIFDLLKILEVNEDAACVSPRILYMNGNPWYSGARIHFSKGKVLNNAIQETKDKNKIYEVDVFSGCAALFDMDKVIEAGLFNEELFMYYDEADFSIKLKKIGYKILYTTSHNIFHDVSYTTKHISHLKTYYMTRNKFIVFGNLMTFPNKIYFMAHEFAFHIKHFRFRND